MNKWWNVDMDLQEREKLRLDKLNPSTELRKINKKINYLNSNSNPFL